MQRIFNTIIKLDWLLLGAILFLVVFGLLNLASVPAHRSLLIKQAIFVALGFMIMFAMATVDYRIFRTSKAIGWSIWGVGVSMLAFLALYGTVVRGAANWLYIGPISVDPIEIVKFGVLVVLAGFLARAHKGLVFLPRVFLSAIVVAIPIALALLQPDLGSAVILAALWFWTVFLLRMPIRTVIILLILVAVLGTVAWGTMLRDYQKDRLLAFINPSADPLGSSYQTRQAIIAVGAGGILGRGFFTEDLSARLSLLPESATDFAYASLIEQSGLIGALLILALFALVLFRVERVASMSTNNFSSIYALGLTALLATEIALNIGMNLGVLPVTGLPLPFISYGGSHTLVLFATIGLLQSIRIRQPALKQVAIMPIEELTFESN